MDILEHLDVLIGLAVVMVLISPLVTALTQLWLWLRNRRSIFLFQALERLIVQLHRKPDAAWEQSAHAIAAAVANHPLLARTPLPSMVPKVPPFKNRNAEVIEREEFVRILLELATTDGAGATFDPAHRAALIAVLDDNGISDPAQALKDVRTKAQELEEQDPKPAAHVRYTQAIIAAIKTEFVGKVHDWFDPVMARATQQYAAEARAVTIAAALIVAVGVQLDSMALVKRLSADDALRTALLTEAREQQALLDAATKAQNDGTAPGTQTQASPPADDALGAVARKQQDVEQRLATLRDPALGIIPGRFAWQPLGRATLEFNPTWDRPPRPKTYELRAGGSTFTLRPIWRRGVLEDLRDVILKSGAPVQASIVSSGTHVLIRSTRPLTVSVRGTDRVELVEPLEWAAVATLPRTAAWATATTDTALALMVDGQRHTLTVAGGGDIGTLFSALPALISAADSRLAVACRDAKGAAADCSRAAADVLTIWSRGVNDIQLLATPADPFSNLLTDTERQPTTVRVGESALRRSRRTLTVSIGGLPPFNVTPARQALGPTAVQLASAINQAAATMTPPPVAALTYPARALVLTAQRPGPLELRWDSARADANMLNAVEPYWPIGTWTQQTALGIILSWALLSLGAPFWFDTLKNLLKLRPSAAAAEQRQREDRQNASV